MVRLYGPTIVQTMVWRSVHTCDFGSDQTKKSESPNQTRQVWKHPELLVVLIQALTLCTEKSEI